MAFRSSSLVKLSRTFLTLQRRVRTNNTMLLRPASTAGTSATNILSRRATAALAVTGAAGAALYVWNESYAEARSRSVMASVMVATCESAQSKSDRPLTRYSVSNAVEPVMPAVVNIKLQTRSWRGVGESSGSGFIVDKDGTIFTNAHVVLEAVGRGDVLRVTLPDGRVFPASVLGLDEASDVAIVKLTTKKSESFPFVQLGDSESLRVGEIVVAIGSPLRLSNSVTQGIISNMKREDREMGLEGRRMHYLQTDAAINVGNSGGPLIDLDGRVVGINTMTVTSGQGISFAIPINIAKTVVSQLKSKGRVVRPFVGLRLLTLEENIAAQIRREVPDAIAADATKGSFIVQVAPNSPAAHAGLREGDVIVSYNGKPIHTTDEFITAMGFEVGQPATVEVLRRTPLTGDKKGSTLKLRLTPTESTAF